MQLVNFSGSVLGSWNGGTYMVLLEILIFGCAIDVSLKEYSYKLGYFERGYVCVDML